MMSEFNASIPIGFRFEPTDEELIRGFLLARVMGLPLPWNRVVEKELYGAAAAPWVVLGDVDESSICWHTKKEGGATKSTIYVFTTLTRVSNSKRISRTAGGSTWSGQSGPKNIKNSVTGEIIGRSRMLSYQYSKSDSTLSSDLGHWIMHEYSLSEDLLMAATEQSHGGSGDLVLCKITRCIKNPGGHRATPQPQFFSPAVINGGGCSDIWVPVPMVSNKRAAEECWGHEVETAGCKKHKLSGGGGSGGEGFLEAASSAAEGCGVEDDSWLLSALDDNVDIGSLINFDDYTDDLVMVS